MIQHPRESRALSKLDGASKASVCDPTHFRQSQPTWVEFCVDIVRSFHVPILAAGHLVIFCFVYWLALVVRFESIFPYETPHYFWLGMPLVATVKLCVFYLLRNFHGWWRYVTFADLVCLGRASIISMLTLIVAGLFLAGRISIAEKRDRH